MRSDKEVGRGEQVKIKWVRLKRICKEILPGMDVEIHGSTLLPSGLKAAVKVEGRKVDIALNFYHIKSEEDIFRAISHELAHIVIGSSSHSQEFSNKWDELYKTVKSRYQEV